MSRALLILAALALVTTAALNPWLPYVLWIAMDEFECVNYSLLSTGCTSSDRPIIAAYACALVLMYWMVRKLRKESK